MPSAEVPPQPDTPAVLDRAAYQASKAMMQARLSGEPYIGYAELGRFAALAVAPVVAEHIAQRILADADKFIAARSDGGLWESAYRAAYVARQTFPKGDDHA